MALAAMCCEGDTIPKPDGLAWPRCGPSPNRDRAEIECRPMLSGSHSSVVRCHVQATTAALDGSGSANGPGFCAGRVLVGGVKKHSENTLSDFFESEHLTVGRHESAKAVF